MAEEENCLFWRLPEPVSISKPKSDPVKASPYLMSLWTNSCLVRKSWSGGRGAHCD
jgi:hypothetical protein